MPISLGESTAFTMSAKTIGFIIFTVASFVGWALHQSFATSRHTEQIEDLQGQIRVAVADLRAEHDLLEIQKETLFKMDAKLDYLTSGRQGQRPQISLEESPVRSMDSALTPSS